MRLNFISASCLAAFGFLLAGGAVAQAQGSAEEQKVIELINQYRQNNGLSALAVNNK